MCAYYFEMMLPAESNQMNYEINEHDLFHLSLSRDLQRV